jgi:hypothetical protein
MPLLDFMWTMFLFFLFFAFILLVVSVFIDIFRNDDLGGWGKALWAMFVLFVPIFGVLIYLVAHGADMQERAFLRAPAHDRATDAYALPGAERSDAVTDEITQLDTLRRQGVLTDEEFESRKAELLG